eukprot:SAG31_NODE_7683_length_1618_cov_1.256748_1_plen_265_part_00
MLPQAERRQAEEDAALLPQILSWLIAARVAFESLNPATFSRQRMENANAPYKNFDDFCKFVRGQAIREGHSIGAQLPQTPSVVRYAAEFFSLIIDEGARAPKPEMVSLTHLCDLMASYYDGETAFVQHVRKWTKTPEVRRLSRNNRSTDKSRRKRTAAEPERTLDHGDYSLSQEPNVAPSNASATHASIKAEPGTEAGFSDSTFEALMSMRAAMQVRHHTPLSAALYKFAYKNHVLHDAFGRLFELLLTNQLKMYGKIIKVMCY